MMHILFKGSESRNRIIHATGIFLDQETQSEDTGSQLTHVELRGHLPRLRNGNYLGPTKYSWLWTCLEAANLVDFPQKKTWTLFKKRGTYKQRHLGLSYQVPQAMVY